MMYAWIRGRATFANVAMTLALVFAMSGGAYAARRYLITSTSQISPKVMKKLKGKTGPQGVQGPQGPAGAPGKDGASGVNGKDGTNGTNGTAGESVTIASATASECKEGGGKFSNATGTVKACSGKNGESVVMKPEPSGTNCTQGGESFTVGGKTEFACNGSPWTAKGTLPEGSTEKGVWTVTAMPVKFLSAERQSTAISFGIPLAAGLPYKEGEPENNRVHIVEGAGEGKFEAGVSGKDGMATGCPTTSEANKPEAEPGNLCIFETFAVNVKSIEPKSFEAIGPGSGPWGTQLVINPEVATERIAAFGTWAVTA